MYQFKIHNADNLSTAVDLFNASDEPVYIAGGHTLIPKPTCSSGMYVACLGIAPTNKPE